MEASYFCFTVALCIGFITADRSAVNDYQRSEGRELQRLSRIAVGGEEISMVSLEECAKRCSLSLDCRSFNYHSHSAASCKLLPWTRDTPNSVVKNNVNYDLFEKKDFVRKCIMGNGKSYRGTVSMTVSGRTCQHWWSKFPHDHRHTPSIWNGLEENYCRNPDGDATGPWCYTTDPNKRYETCKIPACEEEVCVSCNGEDYRGQVDHTVTGQECQRWDQQHPHPHPYQPEKYPEKSLDDNYCRNPDASPVPWCYTSDPKVERQDCKITKCQAKEGGDLALEVISKDTKRKAHQKKNNKEKEPLKSPSPTVLQKDCFRGRGEDYRGKVNETTSGIPCQRWDSQQPHSHPFYPHVYECKGLEENYCRNPDGSEAPWCFTSVLDMRTAFCLQINRCMEDIETKDCYHDYGESYRGTVRKTRKGIPCQKWSVDTPHKTKYNPRTHPDTNLSENYCRNPDGDHHGPWCYTTDPKTEFDYCAIKQCGDFLLNAVPDAGVVSRCLEKVEFIQCGKREDRLVKSRARIVGGLPGNSPWTVSLRDRKGTHFCGGSLITAEWVISTRQCFSSCDASLSGYSAMMGTLFRDPTADNPDKQIIPLRKIVCGPSDSYLVMLQLERPAELNERVTQICLPPERYIVPEGTKCEIAGWGETQGTGNNSVLQIAQMPVLSNEKCNKFPRVHVKDNEMCTNPFSGGVGACEKDYGGPLACETDNCWVLEGVMIPMRRCGHPQQPNVFIRVSVYVDWIKKVLA
ncbi:hepatocyte growth factor-like protein isoform X1 [Huso huso]|uniref:Hepatocyte growth factor-like protein isoform X1 n=1 Tax=Huso huso TaxID=61971 RepID=A0ABR0YMN7_HUSHU